MYYEQRSNGLAQINNGGNISCSVQTTLAGGSFLSSYSYAAADAETAAAVVQTTTAAADADAATTAEAVAADNHTAKGAPSGLPIFL